jgi:hypothetical protein
MPPARTSEENLAVFARDAQVEALHNLDMSLHRQWDLGRNVVVAWTRSPDGIEVLVVPNHKLSECLSDYEYFLVGQRLLTPDKLEEATQFFDKLPIKIPFPPSVAGAKIDDLSIEKVISRYSIKKTRHRAAVLFDIVNFSLYSPLQQVMQLNSLQHSISAAQQEMIKRDIPINVSRSSTGDGFYVWNRETGLDEDANLFFMLVLALANNAVARYKGKEGAVPLLRSCFHIGSHFEFFQSEALSPSVSTYIVGDLTIELARMVEKAIPGQILFGSFVRPVETGSKLVTGQARINAPLFMAMAQKNPAIMSDVIIGDEKITGIKLYLTGATLSDGRHNVKRYRIFDKHGKSHHVFNAKVNLERGAAPPIQLGRLDKQLEGFDAEESVLDLSGNWIA